jgi:hypothetical protein
MHCRESGRVVEVAMRGVDRGSLMGAQRQLDRRHTDCRICLSATTY